MVLPQADMGLFYSGGSNKSTPGGNQGGTISSVQLTDQDLTSTTLTPNTMWQNVTQQERNNGIKRYHCYYLKNKNLSITATGIKIYIDSDASGPDSVRIGYAGTPANTEEQALGTSTQKAVYDVSLNSSEARMDNDRFRAGQIVDSTRAKLYGQAIIACDVWLIKYGNPSDATPVKCYIKNINSGNVKADFGTITPSSISTTSTQYHFENLTNTYEMKVEDVFCFEYTSGDINNFIAVNRVGTDPVSYTHQVNHDGDQWRNVPDFDLCMKLYIASSGGGIDTIAPTGVVFSNPTTIDTAIGLPDLAPGAFVGFWEELTVPVRSAYYEKSKSEISIAYNSPT